MTELDKWDSIHVDSITISEFLEYLSSKGINLCAVSDKTDAYYPVTTTYQDLLYEYFGIDKDKLEQERRKLLKGIKK